MNNDLGFDVPRTPDEDEDDGTQANAAALAAALAAPQPTPVARTSPASMRDALPAAPRDSAFLPKPAAMSHRVEFGGHNVPAQDLRVPEGFAAPEDEAPLPTDLASALAELTILDNSNTTGKAEMARRHRRNRVAKIAFDLQNGDPTPPIMAANEQAELRNVDPFAANEQRIAELTAMHPELSGNA